MEPKVDVYIICSYQDWNTAEKNIPYIGKKLPQENTPFWEKIIAGIELKKNNPNNIQRNFSEFETYGTYTDYTSRPLQHLYTKRRLRTLRCGVEFLGRNPSAEILNWASRDFDTITFEKWGKQIPEAVEMTKSHNFREKFSLAELINKIYSDKRRTLKKAFFTGKLSKIEMQEYYILFSKRQFDFFFSKKSNYKGFVSHFIEYFDNFSQFRKLRIRICRYLTLVFR